MDQPILIIEDNAQNLYLMRYLLEQNGFGVVAAQDGQRGIEMACASPPLAILLDIQLPLMDGYAVARELRKCDSLKNVPIIAVTSYAMLGDREKALEAGATDYMEKPIDPDTFVDHIRRHIPA
jgi:two-component system, cell cycle response regulator DivK